VSDPELGPLVQRFEVSRADQRSLALVRGGAALVCALCASWLLLSRVSVPVFLIGLLGLVISLAWLAQARRAARTASRPEAHHLSIHRDGLLLAEQDRLTRLRFADVADISVDEERLDLAVKLHDGRCVRIEPRYPGVEIHELMRRLREAKAAQAGVQP
jgi:hypothetical protein